MPGVLPLFLPAESTAVGGDAVTQVPEKTHAGGELGRSFYGIWGCAARGSREVSAQREDKRRIASRLLLSHDHFPWQLMHSCSVA
jgi:hypothetical protein